MTKLALLFVLLPITQLRAGQDMLAFWRSSPDMYCANVATNEIDSVRYLVVQTTTATDTVGELTFGIAFDTRVDSVIVYFRRIEGITATRYVVRGALERLDHERWLHGWYPEDWVEKREED